MNFALKESILNTVNNGVFNLKTFSDLILTQYLKVPDKI